jgi:ribonuclease HIII
MDDEFIRDQRAKCNFYEDASLIYDGKQVDEVLEEFINKDNKVDFEKEYECVWISNNQRKG